MNIISVDGGATKTIAVVHSTEGRVLGVGVAGSSNYKNVGLITFNRNLLSAIEKAKENSGVNEVEEYTFALAGMKDSEKDSKTIIDTLNGMLPDTKLSFYNDGEAGFYSRFPEGTGIVVAPGTGMVSYGVYDGRVERSCGWGWFLDDEGSGFSIGLKCLREATKLMDIRDDRNTRILNFVREYFKLSDDRELVSRVGRGKLDIRGIALLATHVSRLAEEDDAVANEIMNEAAHSSLSFRLSLYKRLGSPTEINISGYGGVLRAGEWYWNRITREIDERIGKMKYKPPLFGYEAVIGSMVLRHIEDGEAMGDRNVASFRKQLTAIIDKLDTKDKREFLLM
ncbi:MAG: hypothetical protein M1163_04020 [Candidatus Thermoplasmatota archaeon]|nr:hypothetical protein [Candidatus Thermoplasmatota archaeon]